VTKIIERNDEHLMLAPKVPPFDGPVTIRIEVRNVAALRKEFEASKVKIDPSPDGSNDPRRFVVTDPDRNRIVFEEDRES
jgi:hypothetical protein